MIRLSPAQALPPHKHQPSELMLFVAEGDAELDTEDHSVLFVAGSLALFEGSEELRFVPIAARRP